MSLIRFWTIVVVYRHRGPACPAQSINDVLVICPAEFQPALRPWIDYRTKQGHFDAGSSTLPQTPAGIKRQIRTVSGAGTVEVCIS